MSEEKKHPEEENTPSPAETKKPRARYKNTGLGRYLAILFAAAFLLLLLAYFMQLRTSEETLGSLKESITSMESLDDLVKENQKLREEIDLLEDTCEALEGELTSLQNDNQMLSQRYETASADLTYSRKVFDSIYVLYWAESHFTEGDYAKAADVLFALPPDTLSEGLALFDEGGAVEFALLPRYDALVDALLEKGVLSRAEDGTPIPVNNN